MSEITDTTTRGEFKVGDTFSDGRKVAALLLSENPHRTGQIIINYAIDYPVPYPRYEGHTTRTWYGAEPAERTHGDDVSLADYMHRLVDNS